MLSVLYKWWICGVVLSGMVAFGNASAQGRTDLHRVVTWHKLATLPGTGDRPNLGVAGAFSGITHGKLLVLGGANFPGKPSWKGGIKHYSRKVYVYSLLSGGARLDTVSQLRERLGYGASVTVPGGVIAIGGKNARGFLRTVSVISWDESGRSLVITPLTELPFPLASMAATRVGPVIYVAGGENAAGKQSGFYSYDLDHPQRSWDTLPPVPGGALSDAVMICLYPHGSPRLYLVGGRTTGTGGKTVFLSTTYWFDLHAGVWHEASPMSGADGTPAPLAAGTGISVGQDRLMIFGGDDGRLFNILAGYQRRILQSKDTLERQVWEKKFDSLSVHHPGFNRHIYEYNARTDRWQDAGMLPFSAMVTTSLVGGHGRFFIPSGEVRPGIRTPLIMEGSIENEIQSPHTR